MQTSAVGNRDVWSPLSLAACSFLPPEGAMPCLARPGATTVASTLVTRRTPRCRGFTLLELMVVVAIIALASAGVGFSMRDSAQSRLEREAQRLAVLLESARAQSRASGAAVRWRVTARGFRFEGLPPASLPQDWLGTDTRVPNPNTVLLGPEPLIGPQDIALSSVEQPARVLHVVTDGLRPFSVQP